VYKRQAEGTPKVEHHLSHILRLVTSHVAH
jgi:hypothetical protein